MIATGLIHLFFGPVSVLYAFKSRQFKYKKYIYMYFVLYIITTSVILGPESWVYYVIFFIAMISPLLVSIIASLARGAKKQQSSRSFPMLLRPGLADSGLLHCSNSELECPMP